MVVVSIVDLWWPLARLGFLPFLGSTCMVLLGMGMTSYLSRLPIPEPEELLAVIMAGGVVEQGAHSGSRQSSSGGHGEDAENCEGSAKEGHGLLSISIPSSGGGTAGATAAAAPLAERSPPGSPGAALSGSGVPAHTAGAAPPSSAAAAHAASNWRLGMLLALVLTVHNLPEGLAVGVSALKSKELGLALASAIFLHNVAEGVVIAVPLLAATGNRWLALGITAASGVSEPLGAALGVLLLRGVSSGNGETLEFLINLTLCGVGGVMIQVSRSELLPQARSVGDAGTVAAGFIVGGVLIGVSLVLLSSFK